jgi:large subunit ribosomal protein L6
MFKLNKRLLLRVSKKEKTFVWRSSLTSALLIYTVKGPLGTVEGSLSRSSFCLWNGGNPGILFFFQEAFLRAFLGVLKGQIEGVNFGFFSDMFYKGLGYRGWVHDGKLYSNLGFTHTLEYIFPSDVVVKARKNHILVFGSSKHVVNSVSKGLVKLRVPDPYRGKGVRFVDSDFVLKPGKQR